MGVKDPFAMDKSDLKEVTKFLVSKKKNIRTLWTKFGEAVNLISSGEVQAMYGWIAMRAALQRQNLNVTNNWPKEGTIIWNQGGFIPKDSKNGEAAEKVINAMLSTEFGVKLTEVTQYPSTSRVVAATFSKADQAKFGFDAMDRGIKLVRLKFPANLDQWIEAWGNFKAA